MSHKNPRCVLDSHIIIIKVGDTLSLLYTAVYCEPAPPIAVDVSYRVVH